MSTIARRRVKAAPAFKSTDEERFLLHRIRWETYDRLCKDLDGERLRMNYDRGLLEFQMTISRIHEIYKWLLGHFIAVLTEELDLPLGVGGSMTFRRKDVRRGLEPDNCFWIKNEARIRGKKNPDFRRDPPPDLIIEIEISRSLVDRLAILAALGVPEVWRFDSETLRVGLLQRDGTYAWGDHSPTFPALHVAELVRFLKMAETTNQAAVSRPFRSWVRKHLSEKA